MNFKVCRNGSFHLRGNVYVHYKSLDSAVLAYQSVNGRYFAGKQIKCEFVNVSKWKVAICGEYMKSRLTTCSHGSACNFIHCFRNPGGDYEWADWDKPPPRYWVRKMAALFGYSDESVHQTHMEQEKLRQLRVHSKEMTENTDRHHTRRSRSRDVDHFASIYNEDFSEGTCLRVRADGGGIGPRINEDKLSEENSSVKDCDQMERKKHESSSDGECSDSDMNRNSESCRHQYRARKRSKHRRSCSSDYHNFNLDEHRLDGERNRKLHYNSSISSAHRQKRQFLNDNWDSRNGTHGIDPLDRDSDRERNHSKLGRSLRWQSKARNCDNLKDGKSRLLETGVAGECLHGKKDADRHHHRSKSSERQSKSSEHRYHHSRKSSEWPRKASEVQDDCWDDGHDSLHWDEEKYHSQRREGWMHDNMEFSEDARKNANRLKENSSGGESENRRFHLKRKSSARNRISRKRGEANSLVDSMKQNESQELGNVVHPSDERCASHDSGLKYNIGVEIDELDRWQPERSE